MAKIAGDTLAYSILGLLVFYIGAAVLMPWDWFSAFFSAAQMIAGVIVFLGWVPDAYRVTRDKHIEGSHLALIGVTLLAAGATYSGTFGMLWTIWGQPSTWTGTPYSAFGRFLTTGGFILLIISPDATKEGIRPPRWYLVAAGVIAVALVAFLLGTQWSPPPAGM